LLRKELENINEDPRINIQFLIDKGSNPNWKGFTGYITEKMIQQIMPLTGNSVIGYSGPKPMNQEIVKILQNLKFPKDRFSKF